MLFTGKLLLSADETTTLRTKLSLDEYATYLVRVHQLGGDQNIVKFGGPPPYGFQSDEISTAGHDVTEVGAFVEYTMRPGEDIDLVNTNASESSPIGLTVQDIC